MFELSGSAYSIIMDTELSTTCRSLARALINWTFSKTVWMNNDIYGNTSSVNLLSSPSLPFLWLPSDPFCVCVFAQDISGSAWMQGHEPILLAGDGRCHHSLWSYSPHGSLCQEVGHWCKWLQVFSRGYCSYGCKYWAAFTIWFGGGGGELHCWGHVFSLIDSGAFSDQKLSWQWGYRLLL